MEMSVGHKILALLLLMMFSSASYSELVIRVTKGNDKPTKIAIAPIDQAGIQIPEDISRIVEADLQRSGLFETIERRNMLAFPGRAQDVYYRDWRLLGTEYLIAGQLRSVGAGR